MKKIMIVFIVALIAFPVFAQESEKKVSVEDYLRRTSMYDPQFSPDGKWIAYVKGIKKRWDGRRNSDIWLVSVDGKQKRQLTNSADADWGPRWSPDGSKILFSSTRSGKRQLHSIALDGGEATALDTGEDAVRMFRWIDDHSIVMVTTSPQDSSTLAQEKNAGGGYVVGTQFRKSTLWVQSLKDPGEREKIIEGRYYISDVSPSSDGKYFALITSEDSDLYKNIVHPRVVLIDRKGKELFTFDEAGGLGWTNFSPGNSHFAFYGSTVGFSASNALFVVDVASGTVQNLTEDFDPTIQSLRWLDEESLCFLTLRRAYTGLYRVDIRSGKIDPLIAPYYAFFNFSVHPATRKVAFIGTRGFMPNTLFLTGWGRSPDKAEALEVPNEWMRERNLGRSRVIAYPTDDGQTIEAVLTLPHDFQEGTLYPLLVLPHGGPDGMSLNDLGLFGQVFSQEGLMVLEPNFRGSIGYGSAFYEANRGRIGDVDYRDIMVGVDYLIREGMVDSTKMVVGGWSFGGTMTSWIVGHTNRFKAAVTVAGVSDYYSRYGQGDINHTDVARWEFKGVPALQPDHFRRSSPMTYIHQCKTPVLIMHGENDSRVPVFQGWELYRALKDVGCEVEMVLYPRAGHGISSPKQYRDVLRRWVGWYKGHLDLK